MWTRRRLAGATFLTVVIAALVGYSSAQNDDARLAAAAVVRQPPAVEADDVPAQLVDEPPQLSLTARSAWAAAADLLREILLAQEPIASPEPNPSPVEIAPTDGALLSPEQPLAQLSPAAEVFARVRPGSVSVLVRDLAAGRTHSYRPDERHVLASLTNVSIALAALEQQRATARFEWETQYWLRQMIINSDNWGTLMVLDAIGGEPIFLDYLRSVGLPDLARFYFLPDWGEFAGSAADVLDLFTMLATADGVDPLVRAQMFALLDAVAPDQRWGLSAGLPDALPGWSVLLKNGWYPVEIGWRVHSAGIVRDAEAHPRYAIVVMMSGQPDFASGVTAVEPIARSIYAALAGQLADGPESSALTVEALNALSA